MLFDGRNRIRFPYSRYGYTRGNGKFGTVVLMLTAWTIQRFAFRRTMAKKSLAML